MRRTTLITVLAIVLSSSGCALDGVGELGFDPQACVAISDELRSCQLDTDSCAAAQELGGEEQLDMDISRFADAYPQHLDAVERRDSEVHQVDDRYAPGLVAAARPAVEVHQIDGRYVPDMTPAEPECDSILCQVCEAIPRMTPSVPGDARLWIHDQEARTADYFDIADGAEPSFPPDVSDLGDDRPPTLPDVMCPLRWLDDVGDWQCLVAILLEGPSSKHANCIYAECGD